MRKLLITSSIIVLSSYTTPAQAWYHHYYGWGWAPGPVVVERGPVVVERSPIYVEPDPVVVHNSRIDRIETLRSEIDRLEVEKANHPGRTPEINSEERAIRHRIHELER